MPELIVSAEDIEIKRIQLVRDRTTLGRNPDNDIVLDSQMVSGRHCVFERQGAADAVHLEDLGSTNGTFVNNKRVRHHVLADGEVIAIGRFRVQFRQPPAPAAPALFRMFNGPAVSTDVPLVKAVTTLGKPGVALVVVTHRRTGYYVARMEGTAPCSLNGVPIGAEPVLLSSHDVLELDGTRMLFRLTGS